MQEKIISKGPIRPPIESGVSDSPQSSSKIQVELEPGSGVEVWVSDTSQGRFIDADKIASPEPPKGNSVGSQSEFRDRVLGMVPPHILARAARIKAGR